MEASTALEMGTRRQPSVAEGHRVAAVQVHCHDVQLVRQRANESRPAAGEHLGQVLLEAGGLQQAGREELEQRQREVGEVSPLLAQAGEQGVGQHARRAHRALTNSDSAQPEERRRGQAEGAPAAGGDLVVHLAGRDAVGQQRGHEGPAADAHVHVEVEDAALEQVLQGAQAPDLVDGPGDAAARADERHLAAATYATLQDLPLAQ